MSWGGGWRKKKLIIQAAMIGTTGRKRLVTKSRQVFSHKEYVGNTGYWAFQGDAYTYFHGQDIYEDVYKTEYYQEWEPWE